MKNSSSFLLIALMAFATSPSLVSERAALADEPSEAQRRALFREGAMLWSQVCGNCHNPRPANERSPAEWDVIMLHMRTRANLPADQARAVLEFLKSR